MIRSAAFPVLLLCLCISLPLQAEDVDSPASDSSATAAFRELVQSVRALEPSRVESRMELEARFEALLESSRPLESVYVISGQGRGVIRVKGYRMTINDQSMVIEHDDVEDGFVRLDQGSPIQILRSEFRRMPDPLIALVFGAQDMKGILQELSESGTGYVPASTGDAPGIEGAKSVLLEQPGARLELVWNPESGRLHEAILDQMGPPAVPEGVTLRSSWSYNWDVLEAEEAEAALQFKRGNRQRLDTVAGLRGRPAVPPPSANDGPGVGSMAPMLDLQTDQGKAVNLNGLRGQVVVLDFWATWCGPCRRALPLVQSLADDFALERVPVKFLTVNVHERVKGAQLLERIQRFRETHELTLPILLDQDGRAAQDWKVQSIPVTIVIDPSGRIAARFEGFGGGSIEELRRAVDASLPAAPGDG